RSAGLAMTPRTAANTHQVGRTESPFQPGLALVKYCPGGRGPDPANAKGPHSQESLIGANAPRCLDTNVWRRAAPHQPQVLIGGPRGPVAGGRLDEIRPELAAYAAELLLVLIGQEAVLENHLEQGPAAVGRFDRRPDVLSDITPLPVQHLANVYDHVQLGRPIRHGPLGLGDLDGRDVPSMGKADGGADRDCRATQPTGRNRD